MPTMIVGLDLAKHVFQVHAVDPAGKVTIRKKLRRSEVLEFLQRVAAQPGRHRSLWHRPSLGSRTDGTWPRRAADAGGIRQTLC